MSSCDGGLGCVVLQSLVGQKENHGRQCQSAEVVDVRGGAGDDVLDPHPEEREDDGREHQRVDVADSPSVVSFRVATKEQIVSSEVDEPGDERPDELVPRRPDHDTSGDLEGDERSDCQRDGGQVEHDERCARREPGELELEDHSLSCEHEVGGNHEETRDLIHDVNLLVQKTLSCGATSTTACTWAS